MDGSRASFVFERIQQAATDALVARVRCIALDVTSPGTGRTGGAVTFSQADGRFGSD